MGKEKISIENGRWENLSLNSEKECSKFLKKKMEVNLKQKNCKTVSLDEVKNGLLIR